jgi:2-oxoglutarate ferredoxin oxidoreductase subunit alpha
MEAAYAAHGDTKHILLFPQDPKECFELTALSFDLAEQLQTPVIMLTDLDLGMNDHMCAHLEWDDTVIYKRGKVYTAEQLESMTDKFGRYLDKDGDGIPWRTIPGTHPTKGAYFTRGSSKDEYAVYTEESAAYVRNMDRLQKKWETAKTLVPKPVVNLKSHKPDTGILFFGTSSHSAEEAVDLLMEKGMHFDTLRLRSFPFTSEVENFIESHERIFVIEQNRDAQLKSLLMIELQADPSKLISVLNYDGMPITADAIVNQILSKLHLQAH